MYAQYCRLNVHVGSSNMTVIRKALQMIKKHHRFSRVVRDARHMWLCAMLKEHVEARELFVDCRF